jgi:hypothetical protein
MRKTIEKEGYFKKPPSPPINNHLTPSAMKHKEFLLGKITKENAGLIQKRSARGLKNLSILYVIGVFVLFGKEIPFLMNYPIELINLFFPPILLLILSVLFQKSKYESKILTSAIFLVILFFFIRSSYYLFTEHIFGGGYIILLFGFWVAIRLVQAQIFLNKK